MSAEQKLIIVTRDGTEKPVFDSPESKPTITVDDALKILAIK